MTENLEAWAPVPIRLMMGGWLAYHGFPKLFTRSGNRNIASMLRTLGVPMPELAGTAAGVLEFGGGLAIVAGARVRIVGGLVCVLVLGNLVLVARAGKFPEPLEGEQPLPGWESSCFYAATALSLLFSGAGRCSAESLFVRRRRTPAAVNILSRKG